MFSSTLKTALSFIALVFFITAGPVNVASAEEGKADMQGQEKETVQINLTQEKMDSFLQANVMMGKIRADANEQLQSTEDEAEKKEIMQKFGQKMTEAIKELEGITPQEYAQITQAAAQNPEIQEKLRERFQELVKAQETN